MFNEVLVQLHTFNKPFWREFFIDFTASVQHTWNIMSEHIYTAVVFCSDQTIWSWIFKKQLRFSVWPRFKKPVCILKPAKFFSTTSKTWLAVRVTCSRTDVKVSLAPVFLTILPVVRAWCMSMAETHSPKRRHFSAVLPCISSKPTFYTDTDILMNPYK